MTGQEQQPVDKNLLFPIAPSSADSPATVGGQKEHPGVPRSQSQPQSPSEPDEPSGIQSAVAGGSRQQEAETGAETTGTGTASQGRQTAPEAPDESGIVPGDIVDTNWNIPLITFPTWGSLLGDPEQNGNVQDGSKQPGDGESAAPAAEPTAFTPFEAPAAEPQTVTGQEQAQQSKTEQWLNAAAQDRGVQETQQINAIQPDHDVPAVPAAASAASPAVPGTTDPAVGLTQPAGQAEPDALLAPPAPTKRDLQHERTANAETETMTPISSAAVVAGTAAIAANVAAPGAVKTTATRTLHTPETTPAPGNDAVGSLSEELQEEDAGVSQPIQSARDRDSEKRNKGGRARSRAIVTVFVIITIVAAAAGLYYLTGLIRTNRDRSSAYASCTQAYSAYKEESETLAKTLKTTKTQQKVGTDQVADVMTVERLKTAVDKAKAVNKPVACSTSMSTDAMRKAAETNKTLATQLTTANSTIKAAAKEVKASVATKQDNDYNTAVDTLKTSTSEATTLLANSEGVVADDQTRTTLQSAIDAANALLQKDKPALADVQKAQSDLQSASDAVNESMETYKTQRAAADAAAAASAAEAQARQQSQQQESQRRYSSSSTSGTGGSATQNPQNQSTEEPDNNTSGNTAPSENPTPDNPQSESPSPSASAAE